ncbi:MAG TPA: hypothetical protein VFH95_04825 [Candidatus Kapabacteria bacterium]|nr:hypothetical protein [Candidatus Kapabacteria bacterium]
MKRFKLSGLFGAFMALAIGAGVLTSSLNSCATLNALAGLSRIQFKLNNLQSVRLAGIDITNKHSISDFGVMDGVSLAAAFASGRFPLTFTLNVDAKNPNSPSGSSLVNALQITNFPWRLLLNGQQTITGNIGAPIGVPAGGATTVIPLQASIDLKQFFANQGYDQLLQLALALSGQGGVSHVQLMAQPTMSAAGFSLPYPSELTIVNTQFSS